jgi:hypothetical protein
MVGEAMTARATLFIPGTPRSIDAWAQAVAQHGLRFDGERLDGAPFVASIELIPNDGHFADAFRLPTVSDAQRSAIANAGGALIVTVDKPLQEIAKPLADVVATLGKCGALAVRIEESKLGYPVDAWVDLVRTENPWALYRAAVVVLSGDDHALQSCGMHVFGLPDATVKMEGRAGNELLGDFNVFQLAEDPVLRSGETFAPDEDTPRRVLQRNPDTSYPASHPCHNPFGVWELGPEGGKGRRLNELEIVFMPPLAAVLGATEKQKGAALTKAEVEAIRDKAVCMTMKPRDARAMERSRGYADIDPERAFEHWQLLRQTSMP